MSVRGFTLVELIIVMSLLLVVAALTVPVSVTYVRLYTLEQSSRQILSLLEEARFQTRYMAQDSEHGVYIATSTVILYEGSSFTMRNVEEDVTTNMLPGISLQNMSDITFERLTGMASATGTIRVANGSGETVSIVVTSLGPDYIFGDL